MVTRQGCKSGQCRRARPRIEAVNGVFRTRKIRCVDVRYLTTFIAVVDTGSMADAARRLDLAPTTVAQQIRALEAELDSRLLQRSGRTVRPSIAGARILDRARALVRDARDLVSASSDGALPAGPLRLGSIPTAMMELVPTALSRWAQAHAGIQIFIEPGTSSHLIDRVASGELDAAVLVRPAYALPKTCDWVLLREEGLVLLAPSSLDVRDVLDAVREQPFIRYDRSVVGGKLADDFLRDRGIRPRVQFELDGIDHIARFVAKGLGVSIVPDSPLIYPSDPDVRRWDLPTPRPSRSIGLLWQRGSVRAQLASAFADMLCN
ncbi:MAG: LysR family transcriptional regulator [Cupriavidus sp.]|nr:LysR family transcriptional regulator [Cupriavidus sp.]MCA3193724.1 LysR family transcriptional regulator [Cupriavidus sp.]MCA3199042.1 LysR family transcriptional regulator [Cupriavidus sp.]MCA3235119.1 LysR family transcriptional regulator [Cupriavidus sp.]